jgi:hypothetical protein
MVEILYGKLVQVTCLKITCSKREVMKALKYA